MMGAFWAVFLFVAAAVLIILEFILPGGILGTFGALALVGSGVVGVMNYPELALFIILGEFLGGMGIFVVGMYFLSTVGARGPLVLQDALDSESGWENVHTDTSLLGRTGRVQTALRPSGIVEIDGRRLDVVSDGGVIDAGEMVRVIKVSGNYILVERVEAPAEEIQTAE
jgi:membrane-bound serine protease (ClpP class)